MSVGEPTNADPARRKRKVRGHGLPSWKAKALPRVIEVNVRIPESAGYNPTEIASLDRSVERERERLGESTGDIDRRFAVGGEWRSRVNRARCEKAYP
jgi:hypothetical protein